MGDLKKKKKIPKLGIYFKSNFNCIWMREEGMEREGERGEKAGRLRGREVFDVQS